MDLRGQCYDGASSMSGIKKGLAGRILEGNPKAVYSHCASHILNLSIVSACKENNIQMVLTQMTSLAIYFNYSPKREKLLECVVEKGTNEHSSSQRKAILGLCKTRWAERDKAYEHFYLSFPFIIKALEIINGTCEDIHQYPDTLISGWEPAAKNDATSHLHALCNFGTIIAIVSIYRLLHPLAIITRCLQGKTVDLIKAFRDIEVIKQDYKVLRAGVNDEFQRIYEQAERLCRQVGAEPCMPRTAQKQSYRDNTPADNIQEYYRRTVAIPLLDCITSELETRFSAICYKASKLLFLVPSIVVQDEFNSDVNNIIGIYEDDLIDKYLVDQELGLWKRKWSVCSPIDRPDTLASALISCDEERFPNIFRLMKIGCTLPITSCTCERSFSTLRRLRNWLRSSMTCRRLSSLALMNIHYSHPVNYDTAVEIFLKMHPRRIELSNLLME